MNVNWDAKRGAGRVNRHGAAAATGMHRADPINTGAVRYDGHAERSMRACAGEVISKAARTPKPAALRISRVVRRWKTHVQSRDGGHICASRARHGDVLGNPSGAHESEVDQDTSQDVR